MKSGLKVSMSSLSVTGAMGACDRGGGCLKVKKQTPVKAGLKVSMSSLCVTGAMGA